MFLKYFFNFDSTSIIIAFITIIIFCVIGILFFWFILSDQYIKIILDKTDFISDYIGNLDTPIKNANFIEIDKSRLDESNKREQYNKDLLWTAGVLPFVIVFILLFIVFIICAKYFNYIHHFDRVDLFLIFCAIIAFIFEVIFYLVVIENWKFIGDNQILLEMVRSSDPNVGPDLSGGVVKT